MNEKIRSRGPTVNERLQLAERSLLDHAKTLTVHNSEINDTKARLQHIEDSRNTQLVLEARREEREKARTDAVNARFDHVETQLKAIKENGNKVVWIVLGSVLLAITTFIIKGGLFPS